VALALGLGPVDDADGAFEAAPVDLEARLEEEQVALEPGAVQLALVGVLAAGHHPDGVPVDDRDDERIGGVEHALIDEVTIFEGLVIHTHPLPRQAPLRRAGADR